MILTLTEAAELGFTVESIEGSFRGVAADATASGRDPVDSTKYNLVFPDGVPIAISDDEKPVLTFKGRVMEIDDHNTSNPQGKKNTRKTPTDSP